ncbi:MAG TPA: amidase, partial [bacterium]
VVRRLREAGAVILGKTNLTEWANFRSTRSTSGWSGRGGLTRNPYALDRSASGSSSGSAVAVSANLCAAAVGTETDGSVTSPSSVNGIVGIKPTLGLISRSGIIPIAHSQDTAGPMARTVSDAAVLLGVMAGTDPDDGSTLESASRGKTDYTRFLDPDGLREARIGLARNLFGFHDRVDALMDEAVGVMRRCGAVVVDPVEVPNTDELGELEWDILLYEFKADLNAYLAKRRAKPHARSLEALIAFNHAHRDAEMPYFGQEIFTKSQAKGPLTEKAYLLALERARRLSRREGIDAVLRKHRLDAVAAPTDPPAWVTDLVDGDHYLGGTTTPAAVAGYPHVTLPMGFVFGLPVGVSFFSGAWSEPKLIRIAYAFEQASRARKPPRFLPSVKMD